MDKEYISVTVQRSSTESVSSCFETYRIPFKPGMTVSDALQAVNEVSGDAVAYVLFCRQGVCGGCLIRVNGHPKLACCTPVEGDIVLEPAFPDMVIKDLVTSKGAVKLKQKEEKHDSKT